MGAPAAFLSLNDIYIYIILAILSVITTVVAHIDLLLICTDTELRLHPL